MATGVGSRIGRNVFKRLFSARHSSNSCSIGVLSSINHGNTTRIESTSLLTCITRANSMRHLSSKVGSRLMSTDVSPDGSLARASPNALQVAEDDFTQVIQNNINSSATEDKIGRLFAVVHINGKQRKVTTEDIIVVEGGFPPQIGDRIKLEKVLLVGSKDFTAVGRPMLNRNKTTIEATVIEKTLETTKPYYMYRRKRNWNVFRLLRQEQTMLRINKIEFHGV